MNNILHCNPYFLIRFSTIALVSFFIIQTSLVTSAKTKNRVNDSKAKIEALIKQSGAETVGVAFYDLATHSEMLISPDVSLHAASTMKVPVMMEIYRQAATGKFSIDDKIEIKNDFISIADGSHFSVSPTDDSEPSLYQRLGEKESVRELMRLMIVMSSNLAT